MVRKNPLIQTQNNRNAGRELFFCSKLEFVVVPVCQDVYTSQSHVSYR